MSDAVGSLVGLVPVAVAGGITIGLTREAMKIPGSVTPKPKRRAAPKRRRKPVARKRKTTTRRKKSKK